jgi:hypothetical protein
VSGSCKLQKLDSGILSENRFLKVLERSGWVGVWLDPQENRFLKVLERSGWVGVWLDPQENSSLNV